MSLGDFRFGDPNATPASDAKGGCCGKPDGCRIESDGCLHKIRKQAWQNSVHLKVGQGPSSLLREAYRLGYRDRAAERDFDPSVVMELLPKPAELCPTCNETLPCLTCGAGL